MATKKEKLKALLEQLETLEKASLNVYEIDKEADVLVKDLIEEEVAAMTAKIKGNLTIRAIKKVEDKLAKLKEGFDSFDFDPILRPLHEEIRKLSETINVSKNNLLLEFEKKIKGIPVMSDLTERVEELQKEFETRLAELSNDTLKQDLSNIQKQLQDAVDNIKSAELQTKIERNNIEERLKNEIGELKEEIEKVRSGFNTRLSASRGGSIPLQVNVNSSVASTRYADINFQQFGNIGWSVINDDDNKRVNIRASILSGEGGVTIQTPTGTVDGSNTTFTPTSQPSFVVADGITYFDGAGYTWGGVTIVMDVPPSQYIRVAV